KGLALWNLGELEDRLEQLGTGGERVSSTNAGHDFPDKYPLTVTTRTDDAARRLEAALAEVTEQIRQNPADPALYSRRGTIFGQMNRPEDAVREFTLAIDLAENEVLYDLRSQAHAAANQYVQAIADAATVLVAVKSGDAREAHACDQ